MGMNAPRCLQNNILVELSKAFQDEIVSDGGLKFYQDTTFRPEWNVSILGEVASVPIKLNMGGGIDSLDPDRPNIHPIVKPGDELLFNYLVIMNRKQSDNAGDIFTRDRPTNPWTTVWSNPNGLQIVRVYLKNNKYECGLFDTVSRTWVDKIRGGEFDVENFMGKYMPTENIGFNYRNLLPYEGKDYWKVDYSNAIAIKRDEGVFEMIGDFTLVEPISEPDNRVYEGSLEIYNIEKDKDYKSIGKLISIGLPLKGDKKISVQPNEIICADSRYVMKYEIDRKNYWVIRQKHIYGKQSVTNEYLRDT